MFMYEKDNKLCIVFDGNAPVENPDVMVEKTEEGIKLHVGDTVIPADTLKKSK